MMKLTCNIDPKGSRMRQLGGSMLLVLAVALAIVAWGTRTAWLWYPAAGLAAGGGFMLFEGLNGWCALRAMGFKTKI